jgi:hypothetical protein
MSEITALHDQIVKAREDVDKNNPLPFVDRKVEVSTPLWPFLLPAVSRTLDKRGRGSPGADGYGDLMSLLQEEVGERITSSNWFPSLNLPRHYFSKMGEHFVSYILAPGRSIWG